MTGAILLVLNVALALSGRVFAGEGSPLRSLPSEAKATDDGSLTEGMFVAYSFKLGFERPSEVYCPSWDAGSQDWMNNTALGPIKGPGPNEPPAGEYASQAAQLCAAGAAGAAALASAFQSGGDAARAALAVQVWGTCQDPEALPSAYSAFLNAPELADPSAVLLIAGNYVQAARELGMAACVTVVTLDSDKNLLDSETLSSADGQGSAGPGGAPSPGPPTAGGSEAPLPDGQVAVVVSFGSSAAKCLDYAPNSADTWVNDTMPAWRGTGNETPDVLDVQEFALDMCKDPSKAAAKILDALEAGGSQARVAVAALLFDACNDQTAVTAALQAFLGAPEMANTSTVLDYAGSFVDACDQLGLGCCFTVVVLDPSTGAVLDARKVHTGGASPPLAQSPPASAPSTSKTPPPASDPSTSKTPPPARPQPPAPDPSNPQPTTPPLPAGSGDADLEQCKARLGAARSGCAAATIVPGSPCCDAVLALGSGCLTMLALAASQPGADLILKVAVNALISGCGISPGGTPPAGGASAPSPASPPAGGTCPGSPLELYMAALSSCNEGSLAPGTPCCDGIQSLGGTCLGDLVAAAASNATQAYLIQGALGSCNISLPGPAAPPAARLAPPSGPLAPSPPPAPLPDGLTVICLSMDPRAAACYTYSPSNGGYVSSPAPTLWGAFATAIPSDASILAAVDELCQGRSAGRAFLRAVRQGGAAARAWIAAWLYANCPAADEAGRACLAAVVQEAPSTALAFAQNWVDACQEMGIGACVTVTSLDNSGAVLGEVQVHTDVPTTPSGGTGPDTPIPLRARRMVAPQ